MTALANVLALFVLPWITVGLIQRTRSVWAGRRGPPLLQSLYDVLRLLKKSPVYSATTGPVFRITPWVGLATTLAAAAVIPVLGVAPLTSFAYDFVWMAYVWGLGRAALVLGALDTGSAFEGMGAAREATFSTLVETALLLLLGTLRIVTGSSTLAGVLAVQPTSGAEAVAWAASAGALLVVVLIEGARLPVDDPATHLELTMVHEVMVLDHSGPDLAALQTTSALKLALGICMLASLLNPWSGDQDLWLAAGCNLGLTVLLAICIGTGESLVARMALRLVPRYLLAAVLAAAVALLATLWQGGAG